MLTTCGNGRQAVYLDDTDQHRFLDLLGREVNQQQDCAGKDRTKWPEYEMRKWKGIT